VETRAKRAIVEMSSQHVNGRRFEITIQFVISNPETRSGQRQTCKAIAQRRNGYKDRILTAGLW
jgi:hypothetical protein